MTTAFVLSGGGSLGAVQVGMLQALADHGVRPDFLVGTSAGAVNAAWVAGHGMGSESLTGLASVWTGLRRRDVFPIRPLRSLLSMAGLKASLCPSGPLRALLETHMPYDRLEDAAIPVHVVATDALAGTEVLLSRGPAVDAVLASAAIPGVFDPVEVDNRLLCDGGVANNAALSQAIALGADHVVVLPAGTACALDRPPRSPLAAALHAVTLLIDGRLAVEILHYKGRVDLAVVPHLCPLSVHAADFRHAAELIERSRESTQRWLVARRLELAS
jgi:NTE family protein